MNTLLALLLSAMLGHSKSPSIAPIPTPGCCIVTTELKSKPSAGVYFNVKCSIWRMSLDDAPI